MGFEIKGYGCGHVFTALAGVVPWGRLAGDTDSLIPPIPPLGLLDIRRSWKARPCDTCEGFTNNGVSYSRPGTTKANVYLFYSLDYERCMEIESQFGFDEFNQSLSTGGIYLSEKTVRTAYARRLELRMCLEIAWKSMRESKEKELAKHEWWLMECYEQWKALLQETTDCAFYLLGGTWRYPLAFELLSNFNGIAWSDEEKVHAAAFVKYLYDDEGASAHAYWWYDKFKRLYRKQES